MPAADYALLSNEWTSLAGYRQELGTNPKTKLNSWCASNGLDYARMIPKNTAVRKVEGVANQIAYCQQKARDYSTGTAPEPVAAVKPKNTITEPIAALATALPPEFDGVITAMRSMYDKLANDLSAAQSALARATRSEVAMHQRLMEATAETNTLTNKCVILEAQIRKLKNDVASVKLEAEQIKLLKPNAPAPAPEPEVQCDECQAIILDDYVRGDFETDGYDVLCAICADNRGVNDVSEKESSDNSVVELSDESESEEEWESDY